MSISVYSHNNNNYIVIYLLFLYIVLELPTMDDGGTTVKLLSQAESQSIDLRGVSDADGKILLHLACRKNWVEWYHNIFIVYSLIDNHHCDVAAVDKDGNTPLMKHIMKHINAAISQ